MNAWNEFLRVLRPRCYRQRRSRQNVTDEVNAADRRHRDRAECEVRDCHAAFDLSLGRNFRNKIGLLLARLRHELATCFGNLEPHAIALISDHIHEGS